MQGERKKMEAGLKKNVLSGELLRVCDEWRGSVRIWVLEEQGGEKKNVENVDFMSQVMQREI